MAIVCHSTGLFLCLINFSKKFGGANKFYIYAKGQIMSSIANENIKCTLKIFELFFQHRLVLTLSETAEQCKMTESQISPVLDKLAEKGWLQLTKDKKAYVCGMKLLPFAKDEILRIELIRQITPIMKQLARDSHQSVTLHFLEGIKSICLQKINSKTTIHIATGIGSEAPLHAGSSSRVLLAYAPEIIRQQVMQAPLKAYTPFTITSHEVLNYSLFEIRKTGFCSSIEEITPGAGSTSCAVLDENNNILAALSIMGTRFSYEKDSVLWRALLFNAVKTLKLS